MNGAELINDANASTMLFAALMASKNQVYCKQISVEDGADLVEYIIYYAIVENVPHNITRFIAEIADHEYDEEKGAIRWFWKTGKFSGNNQFDPGFWITTQVSQKMFFDTKVIRFNKMP